MRRVVITGLGMVSPLACGVEASWARLLAGRSGAGKITSFDASHLACDIACEVPLGDGSDGTFNADDWMAPKDQRKVDTFIVYRHGRRRAGGARRGLDARGRGGAAADRGDASARASAGSTPSPRRR